MATPSGWLKATIGFVILGSIITYLSSFFINYSSEIFIRQFIFNSNSNNTNYSKIISNFGTNGKIGKGKIFKTDVPKTDVAFSPTIPSDQKLYVAITSSKGGRLGNRMFQIL
jgi:hypothetical protein